MIPACRLGRAALALVALPGCAPLTDDVFAPGPVAPAELLQIREGAGVVDLPLRVPHAPDHALTLTYRLVGLEAQDGCQSPDFAAAQGRLDWPAGAREASVRVWIPDDELPERDERFEVRFEAADGTAPATLPNLQVQIEDDDRSALLDARELGVLPDQAGDQAPVLQAALDRAATLGRAVLVMAPGEYEISGVSLEPGIALSAHGVRWKRPARSAADQVSLRIESQGAAEEPATLVEGLTLDGHRDEQGPYRDHERQDAHLIAVRGDASRSSMLTASFEGLVLESGTGSGLFVGPNANVTVCGLRASELWRDAITLNGGASKLRLRDVDATATEGTGLWVGVREAGFGDSRRVDVEAEDVRIAAGDVELEVTGDSQLRLQRFTMTAPPFRLDAPGGTVRIEDSVLMLGASPLNEWGIAHDVEISGSVLVAARDPETSAPTSALLVTGRRFYTNAAMAGPKRLVLNACRFEVAGGADGTPPLSAIESLDTETSLTVTASTLGASFTNWFGERCEACSAEP